jgi:hypothetical protein
MFKIDKLFAYPFEPLYREVIPQDRLEPYLLASSQDSRLKALRYCPYFIHDLNIVSSLALSILHTQPSRSRHHQPWQPSSTSE